VTYLKLLLLTKGKVHKLNCSKTLLLRLFYAALFPGLHATGSGQELVEKSRRGNKPTVLTEYG
jgi:hypothetical protein